MLALMIAEILVFILLMFLLYKVGFFTLLGRAVKELGLYKKHYKDLNKQTKNRS